MILCNRSLISESWNVNYVTSYRSISNLSISDIFRLLSRTTGASISNAAENVASTSKAQTIKENVLLFEDILEDLQAGSRCFVPPINNTF